jgi:hypothetical protein
MFHLDLQRLPTIDQLKQKLNIVDPGLGNIHLGYLRLGLHVDDKEAQHAVVNVHDKVQFNTGIEMPDMVYRGQVQEFAPCVPGLGRLEHLEEKLVAICRNVAFEDAISVHPYVNYCAKLAFNGHSLHIDYQGLAQHYGFHTNMLDVTSNFDVAMFFACCEWNPNEGCYLPVSTRAQPGVIYGVPPALFSMGEFQLGAEFSFVGWQPLQRPAQQRAGAFTLRPGQCFTKLPGVMKAYFRHDKDVAEKVWRAFDGGSALFPNDEAAELSRIAQNLDVVTETQLARAWQMLEKWEGKSFKKKRRKNTLKGSGLKIVKKAPLNWDRYNLPSMPEKLHARLNSELDNIRFRWAYKTPCKT